MNDPLNPFLQGSVSLPKSLHHVLVDLHHQPYPHVPNPPSCKKRASVALILRVRPTYDHWPASPSPSSSHAHAEEKLNTFFAQEWVRHGEPEVLFIKRATRTGDRWTGHVALPGGKRDPEDPDDQAAAIRETSEEIGLDLATEDCIPVGNLPERVVTTSWGAVPLMVLCPFVFLWTRSDSPSLRLQPTEVASTHWVPLRTLLSPSSRTAEYVDLSERYVKRAGYLARLACRSIVGYMQFSAIRLNPTESLCCNSMPGFFPAASEEQHSQSLLRRWNTCLWDRKDDSHRPLHLWGLTLGILADLLDMLPPHTALLLWKYPTFTAPDLRLIVSILTYRLRKRNIAKATSGVKLSRTALDGQTAAVPVPETPESHDDNHVGIGGLGAGRYRRPSEKDAGGSSYAVGIMLKGYYERVRLAMYIFLAWRAILGGTAAVYAWRAVCRR